MIYTSQIKLDLIGKLEMDSKSSFRNRKTGSVLVYKLIYKLSCLYIKCIN